MAEPLPRRAFLHCATVILILHALMILIGVSSAPAAGENPHATGLVPLPFECHPFKVEAPKTLVPLPSRFDWREQGKVTPSKDQGACGVCWAFTGLANFEAKVLMDGGPAYDFSENNVKECEFYHAYGFRGVCGGGNYWMVASYLSAKGTVQDACDPFLQSITGCVDTCAYGKTLLDWRAMSEGWIPPTDVLKATIMAYGPVYAGVNAGHGDAWAYEFQHYDGSYTLFLPDTAQVTHALLLIGWDDNLPHVGGQGAWIAKNSWGPDWGGPCGYGGEGGFCTIAYGSANVGRTASYLYEWQDYDPNGRLFYYDEAACSGEVGYGSTTAWGLCKFVPQDDVLLQRVEFWSADSVADADAYIYDDFDGATLSKLITSQLDYSVGFMGYHSIRLGSPAAVRAGDTVYVALKLTTKTKTAPLLVDAYGPKAVGMCYTSPDGSDWVMRATFDLGIRLRATRNFDETAPDLSLSVLQNPYVTNHLDVYLIGSEPLVSSSVGITANGAPLTVVASDTLKHVYRADYDLKFSGPLAIVGCATDRGANDTCVTRNFSSAVVTASLGGTARSLDGGLELGVPVGAVRQDAFLLVSGSVGGNADARGVYEISPAGLTLGQLAEIRIAYADTTSHPYDLCVARVTGSGFVLLASFVDPERRQIVAYTDCLGLYTLRRADGMTNPQLGASGVMLMQNYPNPFSGGTSINYWISRPGHVKIYIVTVDGRLVKSLWDGEAAHAGMYRADWDRTDSSGQIVASGVYYLRADSDAGNATKKIVVAN